MPVKIDEIKKTRAAREASTYAGIPIVAAPTVHTDMFDAMVGQAASVVDVATVVPPLEYCNVMWCGDKGGGKSSTIMGNPFAVILKCGDGSSAAPRKPPSTRVVECTHYEYRGDGDRTSFEKNFDLVLNYAAKIGHNSDHRTIGLDSLYTIVQWMMGRETAAYAERLAVEAERFARRNDADGLPAPSTPEIRPPISMRDIKDANMNLFPKIGETIAREIMHKINGLGWGLHTCVHYRLTYDPVAKMTVIKGDVPNSCFGPLYKYAEMVALCERIPGEKDTFTISTHVEKNPEFTARVPMRNLVIPNHADLPAHYTAFDLVYGEFEKGRAVAEKNQRTFEASREKALANGTVK